MNFDFQKKQIENYFKNVYIPNGTFLAGGSILSLMMNKEVNDLDLYFSSAESVAEFLEENKPFLSSVTDKSITCSVSAGTYSPSKEFQLIYFNYYNSANEIFNNFDYTCCMAAYSFDTKEFYFHEDFFKDVASKRLVFNSQTRFPVISLLRSHKYINKGFSIDNHQLRKIALAVSKLDLSNKQNFIEALGSMYGSEFAVDLILQKEELFNPDTALESFAEDNKNEPRIIFAKHGRIKSNNIEKSTPYKLEWMLDYLRKSGKYYESFSEQYFYVDVEESSDDARTKYKKYTLIGESGLRICESKDTYCDHVTDGYALTHILLYKHMYDPYLRELNQMLKDGEGFINKKDKDLINF